MLIVEKYAICANNSGVCAGFLQDILQDVGCGSLSVCPNDSNKAHFVGGVFVEVFGANGHRNASVWHDNLQKGRVQFSFGNDGNSTIANHFAEKVVPIILLTF